MKQILEISKTEMEELLKKENALLVDIRDPWEFKDFNMGGINIPSHEINEHLEKLQKYELAIIACSNGTRSYIVSRLFQKKLPDTQIYHLTEGIF